MNYLKRWYDIEVSFDEKLPEIRFTGELDRADSIDKLIKMMELTGEVKFHIEGRKIKVLPI